MTSTRTRLPMAASLFAFFFSANWVQTARAQDEPSSPSAAETSDSNPKGDEPTSSNEPPAAASEHPATGSEHPATASDPPTNTSEPEKTKSEPARSTAPPVKKTDESASQGPKNEAPKRNPAASGNAKEPAPPPPPRIDYSKVPWTYHQKRFDLGAGVLFGWVMDPAFDLFQTANSSLAWEVRGAAGFFLLEKLSLSATARFNQMSVEGEARTLPSFLRLSRAQVGAEARYHFVPRVYAYGRIDLGAFLAQSRLGERDSRTRMELTEHGFSGGAHLGGAVRVAGSPDGRVRRPRVHLFAEGGLEYDSALGLTYKMADEGALRPAPVELGTLSVGGPRIALGALVSY